MYEWHGWATIRDTCSDEDSIEWVSEATLSTVRSLLTDQVSPPLEIGDLRCLNGDWQVWLAGYRNHRRRGLVPLYHAIALAAPGSYGMLHVRDDEHPDSPEQWLSFVMTRGAVRSEVDRFLSPHRPRVEDLELWEAKETPPDSLW